MLGDLIIKLKTFFKQNISCRHDYKYKVRHTINQDWEIAECIICGRTKVKQI